MKVTVVGAGSFGMALTSVLFENGHEVTLWTKNEQSKIQLQTTRKNEKFLKDFYLPDEIEITNDNQTAFKGRDVILLCIPSSGIRPVLTEIKEFIEPNQIIINSAKGFDEEKDIRLSEVIEELLPSNKCAIFSGPSHAELIVKKKVTCLVASSKDKETAHFVQKLFMNEYIRVYTSDDIIGVELGGALKNVIAIGVGILEGAQLGDNAIAAFMTRGNSEIAKIGKKMGADTLTFAGLSSIGDLIVTCSSKYSRNRRCGLLLGEGMLLEDALKEVGMVVEGVTTAKTAYKLCQKYELDLPLIQEVYKIIFENKPIDEAVSYLMNRSGKDEFLFN